ncbi:5587_t:CDS:2, partial [Racocetra persica]
AGGSGKGNIKEEKRGEYPEMVFTFWSAVAVLMISLEKTLGIPVKKYNENQKHFELETLPMKEYQENESLKNLLQGKITTEITLKASQSRTQSQVDDKFKCYISGITYNTKQELALELEANDYHELILISAYSCPTCGRSGKEKGNLVSTLDVYTQSVYLTEDAYVFQNAYWHRKLIPDPQGYLDLQKLLHKRQAPEKDGKLELREKLEEDTEITANSGKGEWKKDTNPINPKPLENPKPHELDFLRRVEGLVKKYLSAYTYTHEKLRIIYEEEYLNEINKVVDEFNHEGDVGKSEDYAFDHFRLIDHKAGVSDSDYKLYLEQASKRNFSVKVERSVTVLEALLNSGRDLENRSDENIEQIIKSLKDAKPLVDDTMKTRIEKTISGFGKEMARRKGKKEEYERYERERQADRQRLENIERNNNNLQAQLNNAISNNNTSEQNRLRQRIVESENEARRLRENIRDYENRLRNLENRRIDGQEVENNSDKLFIQYDVGSIFTKGKMSKGIGSLMGGIGTIGQGLIDVATNVLTFGHGTNMLGGGSIQYFQADVGSVKGRHPSVSGIYFSEFATEDHRGGGPFGNQAGSYILPYFYGYSNDAKDDAGNKLRFTQSKKRFEVDTHNLPAHYLYTHCYYNFRIYGEDFAKMYGDLNTNDGGLAKWAAMAIGTLALNAGGAAISGLANCATVSEEGAMNTARAKSINRAADVLTFRD